MLEIDAGGLVTLVGAGEATLTATAGDLRDSVVGVGDLPVLSGLPVDLGKVIDVIVFGDDLSETRLNPTYEYQMDDDSMEVRAVSAGWVEYLEDQGDDGAVMIRTSDVWAVHYDHLVDIRVQVGDSVQVGDVLGLVAYYGNYQVDTELLPMGRFEIQVNHGRNNEFQLAWCPEVFGTPEFNAAHDELLTHMPHDYPGMCLEDTVVP